MIARMMAGALLLGAGALSAQAGPARESPMQWFARMDRNGDGRLSRREVPSPRFAEFDTDADGFVTRAEWQAHLNRAGLQRLDRDGDGRLSQAEFNVLYFNAEEYFRVRRLEAQPADGRTLPHPLPVKDDPLDLRFTRDYVPGTDDPQGRRLAATEANHLATHQGSLFASFGATYRNPPTADPGFRGYAILRKDGRDTPWTVDLDLGPQPYRIEAMASVTFATTHDGRTLDEPAALLAASPWGPERAVRVRDDASGLWLESQVEPGDPLPLGQVFTARAFGAHRDGTTGVSSLFAGVWRGSATAVGQYRSSIRRAGYDPDQPGGLRWDPEPELDGVGRILAFAECNGSLYAAAGIFSDAPESGGIFRRLDGSQPRWEQVYRWREYDLTVWDDEQRIARGLTCVPDPAGGALDVLIAFRYFPEPVIERIDPNRGHAAIVEMDLRSFFGRAFHGGGRYTGPIRAAYNPFTAFTDPRTGAPVHLAGVQIYHPGFPEAPFNGSHYLVRRSDGTYDWGMVFDPGHPVPDGRSLDATREILVSPFPEDEGRALYFAGYDGPWAGNLSAWIYRAAPARLPPGSAR
jgi:hypothetical protein